MRRMLQLFMAMGLFGVTVGCHHMVGVCDCEPHGCPTGVAGCPGCGCGGAIGPHDGSHIAPAALPAPGPSQELPKPEALKQMPRAAD